MTSPTSFVADDFAAAVGDVTVPVDGAPRPPHALASASAPPLTRSRRRVSARPNEDTATPPKIVIRANNAAARGVISEDVTNRTGRGAVAVVCDTAHPALRGQRTCTDRPHTRAEVTLMAEKFTCQACGATFDSKEKLDQHTKTQHMQPSQPTAGGQQKKGM